MHEPMCARHPCTHANLLCVSALHLRFSASDHAHGRGARPGRESHIFSCCNHSARLVRPPLPSALTELSATTAAAFSCLYRQNRLPVRLACTESCLYHFLRHHLPVRPEPPAPTLPPLAAHWEAWPGVVACGLLPMRACGLACDASLLLWFNRKGCDLGRSTQH